MNKKKFFSVSLIALLVFSGCIVLYGKLIEGTWKVDAYYRDGDDQTSEFNILFADYEITIHADGKFTETFRPLNLAKVTIAGTWELKYNEQQWQLTLVDDTQTRIFDIEKVTNTELRLARDLGEGNYEELIMERPPVP